MKSLCILLLAFLIAPIGLAQQTDQDARDIFLGSRRDKAGPSVPPQRTTRRQQRTTSQNRSHNTARNRPSGQSTSKPKKPVSASTGSPNSGDVDEAQALGIGYTVFLKDASGSFARVDPTRVFRTGESVRILVETTVNGYIYLFHQPGNGAVKMLFPTWLSRSGDNRIYAHYPQILPDPNLYEFAFVGDPAVEKLTIIVSSMPIPGIPIGQELKGLMNSTMDDNVLRQLLAATRVREYHSNDQGAPMTKREGERDIEMVKSDPLPSNIFLAQSGGQRVIATFNLEHR